MIAVVVIYHKTFSLLFLLHCCFNNTGEVNAQLWFIDTELTGPLTLDVQVISSLSSSVAVPVDMRLRFFRDRPAK